MTANKELTAKEYLQQAYRLRMKISDKTLEIEHLRGLKLPSLAVDSSKTASQPGNISNSVADAVAKIIKREEDILAEVSQLVDLKCEIERRIDAMPDNQLRIILQKRYLLFQKWEQIAVDMGFTFQWVHALHNKALKSFENNSWRN